MFLFRKNLYANQNAIQSICFDLEKLLTTRAGSLIHQPNYGLVDFTDSMSNFSNGIYDVMHIVSQTIAQYEPRIDIVSIEEDTHPTKECVLCLIIKARLKDEPITFGSFFYSGGKVNVQDKSLL